MPVYLLKSTKQELVEVDVEPTATAFNVKEKVAEAKGLNAKAINLVYSGKIMKDDVTLESANVKTKADGGFIVFVYSGAAAPAPSPAPAAASTPAAAGPVPSTPATTSTPAAAPAAPAAPARPSAANPFAGPAFEEAHANLKGMGGFPDAEVTAALIAAYGDANVAYEFLMTGIPDGALEAAQRSGARAAASINNGGVTPATAPRPEDGPLGVLRAHPEFKHIKAIIQNQPDAIDGILQQIGSSNPELLRLIEANRDKFLEMVNEEDDDDDMDFDDEDGEGMSEEYQGLVQMIAALQSLPAEQRENALAQLGITNEALEAIMARLGDLEEGGGGAGGEAGSSPQTVSVQLTETEVAAVDRLCELGFERNVAIQAFLLCDKNEELAANFLFQQQE